MDTAFLKRPKRVLHLEDQPNDHLLVVEILQSSGLNCELVLARSKDEFLTRLIGEQFDLIISDFSLPSYDGLSALQVARKNAPETPFIFFSGTIGEEVAVDSLKHGAVDYILKQRPHRLIAAVLRALHNAEEGERLKRAESALRQSEERFRVVSRATNDVVWEWDLQKKRVWLSPNFQTTFGHILTDSGLTYDEWFNLIHAEDKGRIVSGISSLLATGGRVWWSEHRVRRADDTYAYIFDRASVIYDAAGKPQKMIGVSIDMTERKEAEQKIREQAALLDKARDAIVVCKLDREITFWNAGAERIYGWTAAEAIGKNLRRLFFGQTPLPPQIDEMENQIDTTGEWTGELQEKTKSGKNINVYGRANVIRDDAGQPKSLLIIKTDITEQKQLEEQFLRAQRLESLGVLVSGIAHDLNNTLVPIIIGVEILRSEPLSEDALSMVNTMEASAKRSAEMVKQMLLFARGGQSSKMPVVLDHLAREMCKIINDTFPKSIQCQMHLGKNLDRVMAISTQIHQVLMNLCVNARDAMSDRGTLTLSVENCRIEPEDALLKTFPDARAGDHVCISVQDTGAGISAEHIEKIFQPFFTTKAPGKGTGLGLSTCRNIIKNHDGFIAVRSEIGKGTEFKVYLPSVAAKSPAKISDKKLSLPTGNGERILVVDDEGSILAITRAALENFGYNVTTAASGMEAISRFRENPMAFSLVITDQAMPFMEGPDMVAAMRQIRPDVKVVVSSASEREKENSFQNIKTDGFIPKPFTSEELLSAVHLALAK